MKTLTPPTKLQVLCMIVALGLISSSPLPAESPFGKLKPGQKQPLTQPDDFDEEDDIDFEDNADFDEAIDAPPPVASPPANTAKTPPRPTSPVKTAPRRTTRPTPTPKRTTPITASKSSPKPKTNPLADYLELDASVKGLQVKNFDLQEQDIRNVVKLISKWTGKNFILDQKVRGKITILGPSQVTLQEAYQAFLSALAANGLTTIQSGKFIRIIEAAEARRAPLKTYVGDYAPDDDQFITRIFQLKYINADEVQKEFRDMTTRQGKLFAYEPTNSVIITDTGSNIKRIREILNSIDIPTFETTLHVLPIEYSSSKKIAELLDSIYGAGTTGAAGRTGARRTFRRSPLERTRGGGIVSKIVPDEQTNSLVILANKQGYLGLKKLVSKLDTKGGDAGSIHVYYCEYAKAEDLAATLAALASGSSSSGATSRTSAGSRGNRRNNRGRRNNRRNNRSTNRSTGPVSAELDGGVKITSDAPTNSLVVTANAADYQTLLRVIKKLDIPRLQVFVEGAIMEVSLGDSTNVGLNMAVGSPTSLYGGGFIGDAGTLTDILTGTGIPEGATIPFVAGEKYQHTITAGGATGTVTTLDFMGVLNLLTSNTQTSLLSTPQIIALDNEQAEFSVQDDIPVSGGTTSGVNTGITENVERLKSGIEIKLTPHVNASSGNIRLDIEQTVESLKPATDVPAKLQDSQRAKTSRVTNTSVVVRDRDYVALGGLMTDEISETTKKVPLLGDIPLLGWLFKSKSYSKTKSNLIILLRPKIIASTLDSANLVADRLKSRKKFIDNNLDGDELHEDALEQMQKDIEAQRKRGRKAKTYNYRNNEPTYEVSPEGETKEITPIPMDKDMEELLNGPDDDTGASLSDELAPQGFVTQPKKHASVSDGVTQ